MYTPVFSNVAGCLCRTTSYMAGGLVQIGSYLLDGNYRFSSHPLTFHHSIVFSQLLQRRRSWQKAQLIGVSTGWRSGNATANTIAKQTDVETISASPWRYVPVSSPQGIATLSKLFYALCMIIVIYKRIFLGFQSKLSFTHRVNFRTCQNIDGSFCCEPPEWKSLTNSYLQTEQEQYYLSCNPSRRNRFGKEKRTGGSESHPLFSYKKGRTKDEGDTYTIKPV